MRLEVQPGKLEGRSLQMAFGIGRILSPFILPGLSYEDIKKILPNITVKELTRITGLRIKQVHEVIKQPTPLPDSDQYVELSFVFRTVLLCETGMDAVHTWEVQEGYNSTNKRFKKAARIAGRNTAKNGGSRQRRFEILTERFRQENEMLFFRLIEDIHK